MVLVIIVIEGGGSHHLDLVMDITLGTLGSRDGKHIVSTKVEVLFLFIILLFVGPHYHSDIVLGVFLFCLVLGR